MEAQACGSRVLILARSVEAIDMHDLTLPGDVEAIAVIEILDPIHEGAAETLGLSSLLWIQNHLW